MLFSRRYRFIYAKTAKTAGTSVEDYVEPYCMRLGEQTPSHIREACESEAGIVGFHGLNRRSRCNCYECIHDN